MSDESERRLFGAGEAPHSVPGAGGHADAPIIARKPDRLQLDQVPIELRDQANWAAWRSVQDTDNPSAKPRKLPINAADGTAAKVNDPTTWSTFEHAAAQRDAMQCSGVMFVISEDGPFTFVDLDGCVDPNTGIVESWAARIVQDLSTYTELSPSGTGLHLIGRGKLPPGGRRKGKIEMYDSGRFATFTGWRVAGTPEAIEDRADQLAILHAEVFGIQESAESTKPKKRLSDDHVIENACKGKKGQKFKALWEGDFSAYGSQSEADLALCGMLAYWTDRDPVRIDRLFRRSGLYRDKWDEMHGQQSYGQATIATALNDDPVGPTGELDVDGKAASQLIALALERGVDLFHDANLVTFAVITDRDRKHVVRTGDRAFRLWLRGLFFERGGSAVSANALTDAIGLLEAKALFEGDERKVHVRIAGDRDTSYIDLGTPDRCVVKVTADGWQVIDGDACPFRRTPGLAPLPIPTHGGSIEELKRVINCREEDWPLILAWLTAAIRPIGPYPILSLVGEHGSAKSTTARVLRSLVDPSTAALRAEPKEGRDLMVTAGNSWLLTLDNLSKIPPWLSDALCRLSTGGGFSTRALFTNDEEQLFDAQRPGMLTSIEDVVIRPDLLDRAIVCSLPRISDGERRTEEEVWAEFNEAKGRIFGALLSAYAFGLKQLDSVRLDSIPRMADFARWAVACEAGFGFAPGTFLAAYTRSRADAVQLAIEASPVARCLVEMQDEGHGPILATATELRELLTERFGDKRPPRGWPTTPQHFSGELRRVAPDLRASGISVYLDRKGHGGKRLIEIEFGPRPSGNDGHGRGGDADGDGGDDAVTMANAGSATTQTTQSQELAFDGDDGDGDAPTTCFEKQEKGMGPSHGCHACGHRQFVQVDGGSEWVCPTCHPVAGPVIAEWCAPQSALGGLQHAEDSKLRKSSSPSSPASPSALATPGRPISGDDDSQPPASPVATASSPSDGEELDQADREERL